jgi:hypothetical protein
MENDDLKNEGNNANTVLGAVTEIRLKVENNFCNRFDRQLFIKYGNAEIRSEQFDARSDEAKRLALEMIWAAQQLLAHHELGWE